MIRAKTTIGNLNNILATREKMNFSHRINLGGPDSTSPQRFQEMEQWCTDNCKGVWRSHCRWAAYFQFEDSNDAMIFALKWGST